jgi:plastocyanin
LLRLFRRATPLALLLALVVQTGAQASTVSITMANFSFTPDPGKAKLGDTIKWTNSTTTTNHTSTQDTPLALWDSGTVLPGGTFSFTITAAGLYPYHCTFHVSLGMKGTVGARDKVVPLSGPMGTMFTVTVATIAAPAGFVYDVQKANPGGGFANWKPGITTASVTFDSTAQATGVYKFRSRLHNTSTGATSGYSPGFSITVT